ncbi:hypothetical protein KUW09_02780 [Mameliella alba]|nr:hypothetical protein [Mameliella sediminis]MBY6113704.1 hypothetical protein [Antarctobacter heliothermus]MBY6142948.1 hypothetical protein [Mameliella alba]MBV7395001.1 hypothetical protein [Mameliella sediminis]MBY6159803.1 hypothetical protein [Mameliella alba]MBY6168274.1 hypothetical protein [Mameliella alba]
MDPAQIETLRGDLGRPAAEDVVCRAMEEVAQRMCTLQNQALSGPREEMHKGLRALAAIADQIGLCSLSRVAHDVMACIELGDAVAEAATMARLARVGERSLTALWDINEFSV